MGDWRIVPKNELKDNFTSVSLIQDQIPAEHQQWFLDVSCKERDIAIFKDQYYIPIPYTRKMGLKIVFRSPFIQKVFLNEIPKQAHTELLELLYHTYSCGNYSLDTLIQTSNHINLEIRKNYLLPLTLSHDEIANQFSKHHLRNIKKSQTADLHLVIEENSGSEFFSFIAKHHRKNVDSNYFNVIQLQQLIDQTLIQKKGKIYCAFDVNNELVSGCLLLHSNNRLIYLLASSSPKGLESRAMYFIINSLVEKFQNTNYILDFEGSSISSIESFFIGFGAKLEPYYAYSWSKHWLCKLRDFWNKYRNH